MRLWRPALIIKTLQSEYTRHSTKRNGHFSQDRGLADEKKHEPAGFYDRAQRTSQQSLATLIVRGDIQKIT